MVNVKDILKGITERPANDLPDFIKKAKRDLAGRSERYVLEVSKLDDEQWYEYVDKRLKLTLPVARIDTFELILGEIQKAQGSETLLRLARAFWLIHWDYFWRKNEDAPRIDNKQAQGLMLIALKRDTNAILHSLPQAMAGYCDFVLPPKKKATVVNAESEKPLSD